MTRAAQVIHIGLVKRLASFVLALCVLVIRIVRRFTSRHAASGGSPPVLLLEPFGLGDVITHEPLIRALQARGCAVTFCARAEWRVLFPNVPWVNSEMAWGRHARADKYSLGAYLAPNFRKCLHELRLVAPGTIGVDTRGDIRSVLLLYLAGCRKVITLANYLGSDLNVPSFVGDIIPFSPDLRRWESNARFAGIFAADVRAMKPPVFPHLKTAAEISTRQVGLIPIAPWKGKWWQSEKWRALVAGLTARGFTCTGLCGPGQSALTQQQLGVEMPAIECASVEEWAAELQQFAFVITLDTGPMHLADALGVPVIALFGQGQLPLWAPSHSDSVVVTHQSDSDFRVCAPIEANTAAGEEFMRRITVKEVLAAIDRMGAERIPTPAPSL